MELVHALSESPDNIKDIGLLADIINTLQYLEEQYGVPYDITRIQEPHLGGQYIPAPRNYSPTNKNTHVLEVYNIDYFMQKRAVLSKRAEQ